MRNVYKTSNVIAKTLKEALAHVHSKILLIATPLQNQEVQAKASSAARWCKHASDYAAAIGTKTRKYLLVPHDEITESKRLNDFLRFEVKY